LKLRLKTRETDQSLAIGVAFIIPGDLLFFVIILPSSLLKPPVIFWTAFFLWSTLGFMLMARQITERRKLHESFALFGVALLLSIALAAGFHQLASVPFAFVGFYNGTGLFAGLVLLDRKLNKRKIQARYSL
jgi:hypothetical protein